MYASSPLCWHRSAQRAEFFFHSIHFRLFFAAAGLARPDGQLDPVDPLRKNPTGGSAFQNFIHTLTARTWYASLGSPVIHRKYSTYLSLSVDKFKFICSCSIIFGRTTHQTLFFESSLSRKSSLQKSYSQPLFSKKLLQPLSMIASSPWNIADPIPSLLVRQHWKTPANVNDAALTNFWKTLTKSRFRTQNGDPIKICLKKQNNELLTAVFTASRTKLNLENLLLKIFQHRKKFEERFS